MKTRIAVFAAWVLALAGCPSGSNMVCDEADLIDLTAKAGMCTGIPSMGKALGGKMACNSKISGCSKSDQATLQSTVDCLKNLTVCTPATQASFLSLEQACYASLPQLSSACSTAFFPTGFPDAGFDAGVDAGRMATFDGGGAVDLIGVADDNGFALAWVQRQNGTFDQWELDSFDSTHDRLPTEFLTPPSRRTFDIDDAGTLTKRSFFLAAVTSDDALVMGEPPDAGMPMNDGGAMCVVALNCPIDQVCDLGTCKTQTCQPGGAVTCPPGYACQPNQKCERMFSDAGTIDAGMMMMGNFTALPLLSNEVTLSTGSPSFSMDIPIGGYAGQRPAIVGIDSARQFVAVEQEAQPFGHFTRKRGAELPFDTGSATPIDTLGANVHLTYNPESDTLFACYEVGRGVRVRHSRDQGVSWGAPTDAVDVVPVDDGGFSSHFHDCALAPWLNGGALMVTIDDDAISVRTVTEALSVSSPDTAFVASPADAGNIYAPDHPVIATLPSDAIVHIGFTATRTVSMTADKELYAVYRDGTTGGAFLPAKPINYTGIGTGNPFPQDYVSIVVDPVTKKALAAYPTLENEGAGSYATVYVSLWDPTSRQWGTGSDLTVFAHQQTASLVLPERQLTDQWDAFSPSLAVTRQGKVFMSFLAGKRIGGADDLRLYLVGWDWEKQSPLSTAKGWYLAPAVKMSQTRVFGPGGGGSLPQTYTGLAADSQLSLYGVFIEGQGANGDMPNRAMMVTRP